MSFIGEINVKQLFKMVLCGFGCLAVWAAFFGLAVLFFRSMALEPHSNNYVIQWESKITEQTGCGTTPFSLDRAQEICDAFNIEFPDLSHSPKRIRGMEL